MKNKVLKLLTVIFASIASLSCITSCGEKAEESNLIFEVLSEEEKTCYVKDYEEINEEYSVIIPETWKGYKVTSIGKGAFYYCSSITSIIIPDSVTSIESYAFGNCKVLESIEIPDSVTSMGESTFENCESLTSVTIGKGVASIGDEAFNNCTSLTSVTIGNGVASIGKSAFNNCTSLTSIVIPDNVTSIGYSAFSGCSSLKSITLPFVGGSASSTSSSFSTLFGYIFGGSSYDGSYAAKQFYASGGDTNYIPSSLKSITITGGIVWYGAFSHCSSITSIDIPNNATTIGDYAFSYCYSLKDIKIPNSVTSIGEYAFSDCKSLNSIVIPNSVTSIGEYAFSDCTSLNSIVIPNSVTSMGECVFKGGNLNFRIYCETKNKPKGWNYCWNHFNSDTYSEYFITYWNVKKILIDDSLGIEYFIRDDNTIGISDYFGSSTSLVIPNEINGHRVTSLGERAFKDSDLIKVIIPNNVEYIGEKAFYNCSSLISVILEEGINLKYLGREAFSECGNLVYNEYLNGKYLGNENNPYLALIATYYKYYEHPSKINEDTRIICSYAYRRTIIDLSESFSINIPSKVEIISDWAFYDIPNLISITFEEANGIKYLGSNAFNSCEKLISITIPSGVSTIDEYTFANCSSLKSVYIHNRISSIGNYAFKNCKSLKSIEIPNSVVLIGEWIFFGCNNLNGTKYGNNCYFGNDSNPYFMLISIDSLLEKEINIPKETRFIYDGAFEKCNYLKSVIFEDESQIKYIGSYAFSNCTSLVKFKIPYGISRINSFTFNQCVMLTSVVISNSVTEIRDSAFLECSSLTDVYFTGTEEEWNAISIQSNNECLTFATIHYNYTGE